MSVRASIFALAALLSIAFTRPASADCTGLTSAHCACKVVVGTHLPLNGPYNKTPAGWEGRELFTYRIPNRCFNQQKDAVEYRLDKGCWKACRDAYGIEGATPDPEIKKLLATAGRTLHEAGFCGGWVSGETFFAAGTNKFRSNTATGLGITVPRPCKP